MNLLLLLTLLAPQDAPVAERVSDFGRYEGWSEERFDGWDTTSRYVEMRDGVLIAVDVTRPTRDGVVTDEALPVVWTHSRYHRNPAALMKMFGGSGAGIESMVDTNAGLQRLVRHGYVVAAAGVRGSGASTGRYEGLFSENETKDAAELIEWFTAQPWCDGNVGMFGGSYLGITQYMAASQHPPALKALFPDVAAFDMYDLIHPGGVFRADMMRHWADLTRKLDTEVTAPPVEGAEDVMERALADHAENWEVFSEYSAGRYRDHDVESLAWLEHGPTGVLEEVLAAEVPCYHWNGWFDVFVTDACLWYANWRGPQRLGIGAWSHGGMPDAKLMAERARLTGIEQHRWFDRWLKGIENGVDEEPPVQYALMIEPGEWEWRAAEAWPPAAAEYRRFDFLPGPSGSVDSVNDGGLAPPVTREGSIDFDVYEVDPTTTTGSASRWDNAVGAAPVMLYRGLAENDRKCLTYTTPPLEEDLVVVGHPLVELKLLCDAPDVALHVLLEEVDERGAVRYVTEGVLRAALRGTSDAPWDNLGLPYQRSFEGDLEPLAEAEVVTVRMDLHPTATVFDAGHRVRVVVMGADADNTEALPLEGTPTIHVWQVASGIELPVLR